MAFSSSKLINEFTCLAGRAGFGVPKIHTFVVQGPTEAKIFMPGVCQSRPVCISECDYSPLLWLGIRYTVLISTFQVFLKNLLWAEDTREYLIHAVDSKRLICERLNTWVSFEHSETESEDKEESSASGALVLRSGEVQSTAAVQYTRVHEYTSPVVKRCSAAAVAVAVRVLRLRSYAVLRLWIAITIAITITVQRHRTKR